MHRRIKLRRLKQEQNRLAIRLGQWRMSPCNGPEFDPTHAEIARINKRIMEIDEQISSLEKQVDAR